MAPGAGSEPRGDGVDAAAETDRAAHVVLVGQGVCEGLHGCAAGDLVAVAVDEVVELAERERSVPAEQDEAGGAEPAAPERECIGRHRRERLLVVGGWAAALRFGGDGPELLADAAEVGQDLEPLEGEGGELGVDLIELVQRGVALDLDADPRGRAEAGVATVR